MNEPKRQTRLSIFLASLGWLTGTLYSGCTPKAEPHEDPLRFEVAEISTVTLSQNRPSKGTPWSTQIRRESEKTRSHPSQWKIQASPFGSTLVDRVADESLLEHFIELLTQLKVVKELELKTKTGPEAKRSTTLLARAGLESPKVTLELSSPGKTRWVQIGSQDPVDACTWITTSPSRSAEPSQLSCVSGNAFSMLTLLEDFEKLRKRSWTLIQIDSVDEMEIHPENDRPFYAQREGSDWADRNHSILKKIPPSGLSPEDLLKQLVSTPIKRFFDLAAENASLLSEVKSSPTFEAKLYDRHGVSREFRIKRLPKGVFGWNSTRPEAVFELDPKNWEFIR